MTDGAPSWALLVATCAASLVGAFGIVHWIRRWRWAQNRLQDIPNERSSHDRPTPRGGGIGVVVVFFAGWSVLALAITVPSPPLFFALGAAVVAGISIADDLRSLSSKLRLVVHSAAAVVALVALGEAVPIAIPFVGTVGGPLAWALWFLWIVGLTNAYNFMDGIDGIAGSQAVVAGLGWVAAGAILQDELLVASGGIVAAASFGFLGHNWSPAKIFLGDVGSAFLGYVFAVLTLWGAHRDPAASVAGVLMVWPFVLDAGFTFLRRLVRRENVFAAHRMHLYQRLVQAGRTHAFVASLYAGAAALGVAAALVWLTVEVPGAKVAAVLTAPGAFGALWLYVRRCEATAAARPSR